MEVFLTVVTGFATFALGQIVVKLVINPVQEFKKVVADISHAVIELVIPRSLTAGTRLLLPLQGEGWDGGGFHNHKKLPLNTPGSWHEVVYYANVYSNPGIQSLEVQKKVSEELRKLSSRLNAQMYLVPCYSVTAVLFGLPQKARVVEAARYLIPIPFQKAHNPVGARFIAP